MLYDSNGDGGGPPPGGGPQKPGPGYGPSPNEPGVPPPPGGSPSAPGAAPQFAKPDQVLSPPTTSWWKSKKWQRRHVLQGQRQLPRKELTGSNQGRLGSADLRMQ